MMIIGLGFVKLCFPFKTAKSLTHPLTLSLLGGQSQSGAQSGSAFGSGTQFASARIFTVQELSSACNDFAPAYEVGVGGHARVYRGYIPPYGDVAIKRAKLRAMQGREFQNELDVLSRVHHRNLVRFFGCCEEGDEQMLVYEFMKSGTLHAHLVGKSGRTLDWKLRLNIAIGTANGLNYLHNHADPPIIHRDVKPSNILLDEKMNAKLGDFGISRMVDDPEDIMTFTRVAGTWGYLDPMYRETRKLTDKSDVYSFGVVLLELVIGKESEKSLGQRKPIQGDMPAWVEKEYLAGGLEAIIDPVLNGRYPYETMCRVLETGLWCTRPKWDDRPKIKEALSALEYAKAVAGKETLPEDSQTMVEVFGQHLFQNLGLKKPRGIRTPPPGQAGGLLFTEDQLLGATNGPGTSYSADSVVLPATYTKVEAR
ncbi:hypothetical protein CBR_g8479 [Chara braunii]|uniref:Protein kinase domain-containing protein n=1 Tax=Chara braunii TaxID=69332 RepID=A0A388KMB4_CHABU|nr:hypothetical protein CBR_g8479 [Chara braunii]|eukprot:GBG71177.1 hypothetical protein CBR_g8479 [Chara braunii]